MTYFARKIEDWEIGNLSLIQSIRIMIQCQNIVSVLNEYKMFKKMENIEMSANEHDKSELESNIIEELIQVETDETVYK